MEAACEVAGHIAFALRQQREANAGLCSLFLIQSRASACDIAPRTFRVGGCSCLPIKFLEMPTLTTKSVEDSRRF